MNKKTAVALAVGTVFATPVLAQGSSVEIYGRMYPQVNWQKSTGASAVADVTSPLVAGDVGVNARSRLSMDVSNSRLGFRGREMLGGGLNAIWQIETRVRFDTGSGSPWAGNRNSFLGLRGGFGTVKLGNMDTIYKEYGAVVGNFFGVSSGNFVSSSAVLSSHGLGLEDSLFGDSGFHIRAPNSIQYETPEFGGFQAGIQYSPDERKGNPASGNLNVNLWSAGVKYEAGPLYVSVQHERHNDWFDAFVNTTIASTATETKDTATRLSVTYALTPQHKLTGDLSQMEWKESGHLLAAPGQFETYKRMTWALGWEARWGGPWRTELTYVRGEDGDCTLTGGAGCSTGGLEGSMFSAGVGYSLSKRTLLFALASKLTNGSSSQFSNTRNFDTARGADATAVGVGVSHSF